MKLRDLSYLVALAKTQHFGKAAEISDLLAVPGLNPEGWGRRPKLRRTEDTKMTVYVADTAQAGDHLLADITAFGRADGVGFESGLGWQGIAVDIRAPAGKPPGDP